MFPNEMSQVDTEPIWRDLLKSQEGKKISIFERQIVNFLFMKQMPFVRSFVPNRILNLSSKVESCCWCRSWGMSQLKKMFQSFFCLVLKFCFETFFRDSLKLFRLFSKRRTKNRLNLFLYLYLFNALGWKSALKSSFIRLPSQPGRCFNVEGVFRQAFADCVLLQW